MTRTRTIARALIISASIGLTACIDTVSLGSGGSGGEVGPPQGYPNPCLTDQITTLVENQHPTELVLDHDNVYWVDVLGAHGEDLDSPQKLMSVPKSGGAPVVLATGSSFRALQVDDQSLSWMTDNGHIGDPSTLFSMPKLGGPITTLAVLPWRQGLAAADSDHLYIVDNEASTLSSMPKSGGAQTLVASIPPKLGRIFLDAQNFYWSSRTEVFSLPKGGGTPTLLASQLPSGGLSRQNTQNLYFNSPDIGLDTIVISKSGGSPILLSNGVPPTTVDDHCMYTQTPVAGDETGAFRTLVGAPTSGGAAATLATGIMAATSIVADESGLYWANDYAGHVMKIAR